MHFHRHDDVVLCDCGSDWPEYAHALFATLFHIRGELMSQQDQINADVALLSDALTGIGKEIQDFKDALAAQAPQLDLSNLDAIAQKALSLAPTTASAPAPDATPAEAPAPAQTPAEVPAEAPAQDVPAPSQDAPAPAQVPGDSPVTPTVDTTGPQDPSASTDAPVTLV